MHAIEDWQAYDLTISNSLSLSPISPEKNGQDNITKEPCMVVNMSKGKQKNCKIELIAKCQGKKDHRL
jgi:hypothetical protein